VALVHGLPYSIPSKRILASITTEKGKAIKGYLLQGLHLQSESGKDAYLPRESLKRSDPLERFIYGNPFLANHCTE
jgi:hypothetical protein